MKRAQRAATFIVVWMVLAGMIPVAGRALAVPQAEGPPARSAHDFEATRLDGTTFSGAEELDGKVVLLDFWAVWCPPCLAAFPKLSALADELRDEPFELVGIAVFSGGPEDVAEVVEDHEVDYLNVVGADELAYDYGVIGYPTYFLVGPEGEIRQKYVGSPPGLIDRIADDIAALLEEPNPNQKEER